MQNGNAQKHAEMRRFHCFRMRKRGAMGFSEINGEHKQHIALDYQSAIIIDNDMAAFGVDKYSTFINKIIANFRGDAKSSLDISIQDYKAELGIKLDAVNVDPDDEIKQEIIRTLVEKYKEEIENTYRLENKNKYKKLKIRLQQENYEYLTIECGEEQYYGENGMGKYLNALIKEYCSKNHIEREKIYAKEVFETAKKAIWDKKLLSLEINGEEKKIKPYSIEVDPLSMYSYLIGYEKVDDSPQKAIKGFSCRISRISKIREYREKSSLTEDARKKIKQEQLIKGVQFLSSDGCVFVIKLTDEGKKMFKRILHLRPNFIEIKGKDLPGASDGYKHFYFLCCTVLQVEYYLLKFGKEAVIEIPSDYSECIEQYRKAIAEKIKENFSDDEIASWDSISQNLRKKFADNYKKAVEAYGK